MGQKKVKYKGASTLVCHFSILNQSQIIFDLYYQFLHLKQMFKRINLCFDVPVLCWAAKVTCGILMSCVVIREERSGEITPLHFTSVGRIVDIPLRRR